MASNEQESLPLQRVLINIAAVKGLVSLKAK